MPELPEVETIRRGLSDLIVGRKILEILTDSPKQVQPSLEVVKEAVGGATIEKVNRRAKILQIFLDNGQILAFHLKLTGRLLVRKQGAPKDEWQHVVFRLSDGLELRFADARKFGWAKLIGGQAELEKLLAEFGPEPFDDLTQEKFRQIVQSSSRPIKIVLMDQQKISGVGNIYACDALFLAKVDPRRPAKSLNPEEAERLYQALEEVLQRGIKYRGASDQYYLDARGQKGAYQEHFLVYGKNGQPCPGGCKGKVKRIVVGGRGTFFCPTCQK